MQWIAETVSPEASENYSRLLGVVVLLGFSFCALIFFVVAVVKAARLRTRGWMLSAALSGLAMLGGLTWAVSMVTEAVASAAKTGKAAALPREVASADGKVSIKIPGSWSEMPELHPAAVIAVGDKMHEQYVMVLPTGRASFPTSLSDFDVFVTEGLGKALQDSKVSEPKTIQVGGYRAIRRSITGVQGGHRTAYEQVVIETHSTYYQMLMWTIFSHRSAAERDFNDIIASFAAESAPALPEESR
ncbi:hypothetical protein [Haloferula sp. BvORR071]|uniref:hypothetical protein n=1 Tax=Haloferula sp. BvORR071 TaxID=1396141 RepID=UPI00054FFD75|nr:hypothetical protein [Haloferula sp. BvORR071]